MKAQRLRALVCGAVVTGFVTTAFAQPAANHSPPPAAQPSQPAPQQQPQQPPPPAAWDSFPTMLLEKIYRGPLKDTVIQRWRDPIDGSVCYVYLPISVPLLPNQGGYVQYGAAGVGSISCIHPTEVLQLWQGNTPPPVANVAPVPQKH
jgi:hypothetical protein